MKTTCQTARRVSQLCWLFLCNAYVSVFSSGEIYAGPFRTFCVPFLYCHACPTSVFSCPIGTLQHFAIVARFPFFLMGQIVLVGLAVGRMACGWFCPFGLFQDLLSRITVRKIDVPRIFSIVPYLVFIFLVLLIPMGTSQPWFSKLCPMGTLTAGIPWVAWNPISPDTMRPVVPAESVGTLFFVKVAILVFFLAFFVLVKRPFCRFVCPVGLLFSFFNRMSLVKVRVLPTCGHCGTCRLSCPMDMRVDENPDSPHCIRCLNCTSCQHVQLVFPMQTTRKILESEESGGNAP